MKFQQHAIITGGSSGIGKATAKLLIQKGCHVSIISRSQEKLEAAKQQLEAVSVNHQQVFAIAADVSEFSQAQTAISTAIDQGGSPDFLITCAGMAHPGYFRDLPIAVFEQTMAINYFGSLYCIKAALPFMKRGSHLVLISSGAGLVGVYGYTPYSPTKFALRGLAESLRGELKPLGIEVSIVYPPDTDTPQLEAENQTKPLETKLITGTAKTWQPEAVAREILRGVQKKSFIITPGLEMSLLGRFHSLLSPGLNWYFDRIVAKMRR